MATPVRSKSSARADATLEPRGSSAGSGDPVSDVVVAFHDVQVLGPRPATLTRIVATTKVVAVFANQLVRLLTVDLAPALTRKRAFAASAGRRMRFALVRLGPGYAKLAQLMASEAVVVPGSILSGFDADASGAAKPVPFATIQDVVERELGPLSKAFRSLDAEPLAVTPLAQVHSATLLDGRGVVVKVQRPGLREHAAGQALAFGLMARLAQRLLPAGVQLERHAYVDARMASYLAELDFRQEAAQLTHMIAVTANRKGASIVLPSPVDGMATGSVLVTERLEGVPLDQVRDPRLVSAYLGEAVGALLWGAARGGVFHADLVPSNFLALPDGRLGIVDFGDCVVLDDDERLGLARLFDATAKRDERAQLHALDNLGAISSDVDRRALLARLRWLVQEKGDLWSADPLHQVPHLFLAVAAGGITLPVPLLRLSENLLHLEATARSLNTGLELGPRLEATCKLRRRALADPYGPPLSADEIAAAAIAPAVSQPPSLKAVFPAMGRMMKSMSSQDSNAFVSFAPFVVFIVLNSTVGIVPAVLAATASNLGLGAYRKRRGRHGGPIATITTVVIIFQGTLGIVFSSGKAFFGPTLLIPILFNFVLLGSVLVGRPLFGLMANAIWPQPAAVRNSRDFRRAYSVATVAVTAVGFAQSTVLVWMLLTLSANQFAALQIVVQQLAAPFQIIPLIYMRRAVARAPEVERRILARVALAA